jgi:hypothetical protein
MQTITPLECQCLQAVIDALYAEVGFSDIDAEDVAKDTNIDIKTVRGALGSLAKKGFIDIADANDYGFRIIYLNYRHYNLHPEWANELELHHEQVSYHLTNGAQKSNRMKELNQQTNVELSKTIKSLHGDEAGEAFMTELRKSGDTIANKRIKMIAKINEVLPEDTVFEVSTPKAVKEVVVADPDALTESQQRVFDKFNEIQPADVWASHLADALGENPKSVAIICGGLVKKGKLVVEKKTWFYRIPGTEAIPAPKVLEEVEA